MKSIKQQYIDLKEGRMSQANFMRNLRMTIPQHVTNVTSFGDAVRILKNKGIINESFDTVQEKENDEYPTPPVTSEEPNEDAEFDAMLKQLEDEMAGEIATKSDVLDEPLEEEELTAKQIVDKYNEMFGKNASTTFKDVAKALGVDEERVAVALGLTGIGFNENVSENALNLTVRQVIDKFEELLGKNPNAKVEDLAKTLNTTPHELAKIIGIPNLYSAKPAMNETKEVINPNQIHPQEYTMGMKYELQCFNGDKKKAEKAVLKNLTKDSFYYTVLKLSGNDVHREKATKPEVVVKKKKAAKPELVDKVNGMVKVKMPKTVKEAMMNEDLEDIDRAFDKSDININTNDEKRVQSAVDSYSRLISALKAINSINETDGLFKIFLEHTLLVNVSKEQLIAQLRKALTTYPGSTFTSPLVSSTTAPAAAISPKKGFPGFGKGADLKEKLTSMVREMLAEETPSKKTAASEITAKAVEYIDDYNEGEKTYKKSQLENVFDSYEDKVGRRFDDSVFEDVIDMLKAKGYTMAMKETFDGRDNLDAENEVN